MAISGPTTAGQPYHLYASVSSIPPHAEIPLRLVLDGVEAGHHAAGIRGQSFRIDIFKCQCAMINPKGLTRLRNLVGLAMPLRIP